MNFKRLLYILRVQEIYKTHSHDYIHEVTNIHAYKHWAVNKENQDIEEEREFVHSELKLTFYNQFVSINLSIQTF